MGIGRFYSHDGPSMKTTIPFLKNNEFDYSSLLGFLDNPGSLAWIIFIPIVIIIVNIHYLRLVL